MNMNTRIIVLALHETPYDENRSPAGGRLNVYIK